MVKRLFIFSLLLSSVVVNAQKKNITYSGQQWFQYYNTTQFSDRLALHADMGFRWREQFHNKSQYLFRAGMGYLLNDRMEVVLGAAHFGGYAANELVSGEWRMYQQFRLRGHLSRFKISHRFRLEERFFHTLEGNAFSVDYESFNFRFRYMFKVGFPIANLPFLGEASSLILELGDELLLNAGKDIAYNIFDQNRIIVSPVIKFDNALSLAFSWNSQYGAVNLPSTYVHRSVFWFQIKHKINARRKA